MNKLLLSMAFIVATLCLASCSKDDEEETMNMSNLAGNWYLYMASGFKSPSSEWPTPFLEINDEPRSWDGNEWTFTPSNNVDGVYNLAIAGNKNYSVTVNNGNLIGLEYDKVSLWKITKLTKDRLIVEGSAVGTYQRREFARRDNFPDYGDGYVAPKGMTLKLEKSGSGVAMAWVDVEEFGYGWNFYADFEVPGEYVNVYPYWGKKEPECYIGGYNTWKGVTYCRFYTPKEPGLYEVKFSGSIYSRDKKEKDITLTATLEVK